MFHFSFRQRGGGLSAGSGSGLVRIEHSRDAAATRPWEFAAVVVIHAVAVGVQLLVKLCQRHVDRVTAAVCVQDIVQKICSQAGDGVDWCGFHSMFRRGDFRGVSGLYLCWTTGPAGGRARQQLPRATLRSPASRGGSH